MTQDAKKLLKQALDSMPEVFSSNAFAIELRKLGFSKQETSGGMIQIWLRKNAFKGSSSKMWRKEKFHTINFKLDENKSIDISYYDKILNTVNDVGIMPLIELIKSKGYRVQKKTETWEDC